MKIKGWITWPDGSKFGWYHCQLILENGWAIYGHLCSSPGYARGDLWDGREERKQKWAEQGLELEIVDEIPQSELPPEVLANNQAEAYVEFAEKYFGPFQKHDEQPSVTAVVSDANGEEKTIVSRP